MAKLKWEFLKRDWKEGKPVDAGGSGEAELRPIPNSEAKPAIEEIRDILKTLKKAG